MTSVFTDELARKTIATQFDSDLFVDAGAGSGKTQALVNRAVGLITTGTATIDRIVMITFTEAAANELKARIRFELENADNQHARAALDNFAEARISTIHAFAKVLLEQAGIFDEGAIILDPTEDSRLLISRASELLREKWQGAEAETVALLRQLGIRTKHWLALVELVHNEWHRFAEVTTMRPAVSVVGELQTVCDAADALRGCLANCKNEADTLVQLFENSIAPWLNTARSADSDVVALQLLLTAPTTKRQLGNKNNWPAGTLDEARIQLAAFVNMRNDAWGRVCDPLLRWMTSECALIANEIANERLARGLFSFHDLLVRAVQALGQDDVRSKLASGISYLFIDEFQDTDSLQWELASTLAGRIAQDGTAPLFLVGDGKQSIYRFRGADVSTFNSVRASFKTESLALTTSFRSTPGVVDFVNNVARQLFTASEFASLSLEAVREEGSSRPTVIELELESEVTMDHVRSYEAELVVEKISELKTSKLSDIAILVPSRTALPSLEDALHSAEIPFRVESPILMWNTQELRDLTNVLRAVGNASDEVALLGALRSPYLGCSDVELLQHVRQGGTWNRHSHLTGSRPVTAAFSKLNELEEITKKLSLSETVGVVLAKLDADDIALQTDNSQEMLNRLSFLRHASRDYSQRSNATLLSFCDWADAQREDRALAYEFPLRSNAQNAVRVMTIHAAKGLEFPNVIVMGLGTQAAPPASVRLLWNGKNPEVRVGSQALGVETSDFLKCLEHEKAEQQAESNRLLYVALSRARDHVTLALVRKARSTSLANAFAQMIEFTDV